MSTEEKTFPPAFCTHASDEFVPAYRLAAAKSVLADRERELLAIKGACSNPSCRLHYAHSGPCDCRD